MTRMSPIMTIMALVLLTHELEASTLVGSHYV